MKTAMYDIEVYDKKDEWEQGYFLVHGYDDVLWTDSIDGAVNFMKKTLERRLKENEEVIAQ